MNQRAQQESIVLFDGVCNFCNGSVNFIIQHDSRKRFKFAPLQSEIGQNLLRQYGLNQDDLDSVVLVEDGNAFTRTTAALKTARHLDGFWSWAAVFLVVPRPVRDIFYKLFAKYRYQLFGRTEACMMPTPDVRHRFLS